MSDNSTIPSVPVVPGGTELYNRLMGTIEPELTTDMVDSLEEKYANETPEEKQKRMERYRTAFEKYKVQYNEYQQQQAGEVRSFGVVAMKSVEGKSRQADDTKMQNLEDAISQA